MDNKKVLKAEHPQSFCLIEGEKAPDRDFLEKPVLGF